MKNFVQSNLSILDTLGTVLITLARGAVLCLSVYLSVCLLTPNLCLNSFFLKSKQAASLKLGNLRLKVVLYKTGKFLQVSVAQTVFKFENKKNLTYRSCTKDF